MISRLTSLNANLLILVLLGATTVAATARGEVVSVDPGGFVSEHTLVLQSTPLEAYVALTRDVHLWWDGSHSFGGGAAGFSLDAQAGGCFCEALPGGGSVQHMLVVNANPGHALTMLGGLGPLQSMAVTGSMVLTFAPHREGSELTYRYSVGGYAQGGLAMLAEPVDRVQLGQLQRLQQFIATGQPLNR